MTEALLVLEDGTILPARSIGAPGSSVGEIVFNTSHSGYQEILTDPSYRGQVVLMTAAQIGNYGIAGDDNESSRAWLAGFVVNESSRRASNFRALEDLPHFLARQGVVAVDRVDTRALTRRVREKGALRTLLTTETDTPHSELLERVQSAPGLEGRDLVREVVEGKVEHWTRGRVATLVPELPRMEPPLRLVALDCGIKHTILRTMVDTGFDVWRVPYGTPIEAIRELAPQALFLSNGPGDPEPLSAAADLARTLAESTPILGICLGHQVLAQALGGKTYKMKFGHHGGNQPVRDESTGRVYITAQNHSFAVDLTGAADLELTHVNLNDHTVEGMRHRTLPVQSYQYHPEAAPGPHEALEIFARFHQAATEYHGLGAKE